TIYFSANLAGQTIHLTTATHTNFGPGILWVPGGHSITLQGIPGSQGVTIAGNGALRLVEVGYDNASGQAGSFTATDVTFTGGNATYGGAIYSQGSVTLQRCLLATNHASLGSAIYLNGAAGQGKAYLENCTFAYNSASAYTVENYVGNMYMQHVTMAGNAGSAGGGLMTDSGSSTTLSNCIVALNSGASAANDVAGTVTADSAGNLIGTSGTGGLVNNVNNNKLGLVATNLLLGGLADNGGSTLTMALAAGSAAIDAGVPADGLTADARALPYVNAPDVGAYEQQSAAAGIINPGSITFYRDFTNSYTFTGTGNPIPALRVSGTLPATLNIAGSTVSGTPIRGDVGNYSLTLVASNGFGAMATQTVVLVVTGPEKLAAPLTFNTNGPGWNLVGAAVNGGPSLTNGTFTPTTGVTNEARSAWFKYPLYAGGFQASFTYQDIGGLYADGVAFVLQNSPAGVNAIGATGGGLGYTGITTSVAVLLNLYPSSPGGPSGVLVATNGLGNGNGYWPTVYQNTAPVDIDAGNPVNVTLRYAQNKLRITLVDTVTTASYNAEVAINATNYLGSDSAYVGLTGSDGGTVSHQVISNFTYTPLPLLQAARSGTNQVTLQWPNTVYGFRLQGSLPGSGSWSDVNGSVSSTNGVYQISLPTSGSAQLYRLIL
ncbi:MAG TPA: L-type lectin-domain containing protein, partial [Verrucomicrobiae bacterium]